MQLMLICIAWCEQAFNLNDEKGIEDAMSFLLGESENPIEKIYTKAFQHQKDGEEEERERVLKEEKAPRLRMNRVRLKMRLLVMGHLHMSGPRTCALIHLLLQHHL